MGDLAHKTCVSAEKLAIFRELSKEFSLVRMNGKRPIEKGWQKYCYNRREFDEIGFRSGDNAGIACGPASGILVLDIDDSEAFEEAALERGWTVWSTYTVQTGNGNFHHYFQYPQDGKEYGNKALKKLGFDLRGVGGLIVAPGSIHPDTGDPYTILRDIPIADAPDWLLKLYQESQRVDYSLGGFNGLSDVGVNLLPISEEAKILILEGSPKGQRSEAIMSVVNSLVNAEVETEKILGVFERYPIGEKYREKGRSKQKWMLAHIEKARDGKRNSRTQKIEVFTAKELEKEDPSPPDWIIEGLLPVGLTLLAGPPKAGKTRLVTQMALELTTGRKLFGKFFGERCSVLCLFLEDSKWRIWDRLNAQLEDVEMPENLYLAHKWGKVEEGGLDSLDKWLEEFPNVRLVIIDVLGRFTSASFSKNIYQGDYNKIENIKALADRHSIAIILVHHLNKLKDSEDIFDKISGSTGLTAAADTVAVLERYNRAGADAKLYIAGRDVEAAELPLRYDSQRGVWLFAGNARKYCVTDERVSIYELLERKSRAMKSKDIAEALGRNYSTTRGLLTKMVKRGELEQPGRGLYGIPTTS